MLGREHGQAFPKGEHVQVPNLETGTDSFYFFLRSSNGTAMVTRLALRKEGQAEFWFGLSIPDLPPLLLEGKAPFLQELHPEIKGLAFVPQSSGSWLIQVDFPEHSLKATLEFTPTSPIFDFAGLRDKNQIAGALAKMEWNSKSFNALKSMKTEHIEQAGVWKGGIQWAGTTYTLTGVGARDHSRGERNWRLWDSHSWFTGFNENGKGFNVSLIQFKGLPSLRAGYIARSAQGAVHLIDGPSTPISQPLGAFTFAGRGDHKAESVDYFTLGIWEFTMDSVYRIEEGFGYLDWNGERFYGILERGFTLNT